MAVAHLEWRLAQAMPLGLGSSSHGFTAPGGRSVAVQLSRQATRARVGPFDFQIHVSDVVALDGRLLHQQVVLQAVQRDEDRGMLQYISEGDEEELNGPGEGNGPTPLSRDRSLLITRSHSQLVPHSPSATASYRPSLLSPFQFHPTPGSTSTSFSQGPPLLRAPTLRHHSLSRAPSLGWSAFLPSFPSSDLATPTPGLTRITRTPALSLTRTPSTAPRPFLRMASTLGRSDSALGRSASALGRSASICMRAGGGCCASGSVQSHALTEAPTLAGAVGVVAMLQEAWRMAAARAAADAALASSSLLTTGRLMEEVGGALSAALFSAAELSTTLDAVAHSLHVSGVAEAAGTVHTVVGAVQASGAALVAAGGALQAVGRWGVLHAGLAAGSGAREVVHTVEAVKEALDSVEGAVQSLGSLESVISSLGSSVVGAAGVAGGGGVSNTAVGAAAAAAHAAASAATSSAAAATNAAAAAAAAAGSAAAAAAAAAASTASTAAAATGAASAFASAAAAAAAAAATPAPAPLNLMRGGSGGVAFLPTTGFGAPVEQVVGLVGALKAAVDVVPGAVGGLAEGLHKAGEAMHVTGEALSSMDDDHMQAVGGRVRDTGRVLRSAGRRIRTAADAAGSTIGSVMQRTASEVGKSVRQLAEGGEVSVGVVKEKVGQVVSEHVARLAAQLHVLAVQKSEAPGLPDLALLSP